MIKRMILLFAVLTTCIFAQSKQPVTLEEIFTTDVFNEHRVENIEWLPDGESFTFTQKNSGSGYLDIFKHDVKSGRNVLLIADSELVYQAKRIAMSHYQWIGGGKYLLIEGPRKSIWRHSAQAPFYLLNVETKSITALANNNAHLRNVKLSPNGLQVGFVRDHNIYILDLSTGVETAVTNNGSDNILNGEFDWVYEEEFEIADAWSWSPDSKKIMFWQFDQSRVKEFHLIDEMFLYNKISSLKYPKVGEQNAIVTIGVFDLESQSTQWMNVGENDDIYIPRVFWTNSSSLLAILRLNRKQNVAELLMANTNTGASKPIITDTDPAWVEVTHDISFLTTKDQIIFSSEKSGFRHAYLYDYNGTLIRQITGGNWEITEISGVDEKKEWVYFYGKKDSPLEQQLYRVKLNGSQLSKISKGSGWHIPIFSPNYKYFIDAYSNISTPTVTRLCTSDGAEIQPLQQGTIDALQKHSMVYPQFVTITASDGVLLNGYIIKPNDFDPAKKYPVIVYGYGGPGSQMVVDRWGDPRRFWHQYMTEQGYIIFCLDNRGTGGRGKAFKNLSYGDLSEWSIRDQIEGAKYLASLPYVEKDRLGFWGWSGGGYLTIGLLTRAADYFKAGVAVAPVTDFNTYDAIWSERQMGLRSENEEGYKKANLQNYVSMLKGKLLIIHGTGDDNVHYQNTLQFIDKCISLNKQVDMFFYPNRNHSISGGMTRINLYTKMTNYFKNNL